MKIPQSTIEQVKSATDIVDLISTYVSLKLRGKNYVGLCPFHQEKTPSFSVSPDKQIFYCFGCGAGGDAISFVRQYEKVSYPEAIRWLAHRAHIEIPTTESDSGERDDIEAMYFAAKAAARFYFEQLQSPLGKSARDYLIARGFSDVICRAFGVGYAPDAWDAWLQAARGQNLDLTIVEKAGLIVPKANGHYDRFRHRIIFPIINPSGRVIAFGGRQLVDEKNSPKYLNSPETPIFQKSKTLYGLYQARESIRQTSVAVLVEGYADCLSLHQYGFGNCVASCGTALTGEHAYLLRRYTSDVILLYDGDEAGRRAAIRGGAILLESGLNVRVVTLDSDQDPDSYLRSVGAKGLEALFDQAPTFVHFRLAAGGNVHQQSEAIHDLMTSIARISDAIKQNLYLNEIARALGIAESAVMQEWKKISEKSAIQTPDPVRRNIAKKDLPSHIVRAERDLLKSLLTGGRGQAEYIFRYVRPDQFQNDGIRTAVSAIYRLFLESETYQPDAILPEMPEEVQKAIARMMIEEKDEPYSAEDCIAAIQVDELEREREDLRKTMQTRESCGEDIQPAQKTWNELTRKITELKQKRRLLRSDPSE